MKKNLYFLFLFILKNKNIKRRDKKIKKTG